MIITKNVEKIVDEITKTKVKITDLQNRLRELERQKTEAENFNIVAVVRGLELEPDKLRDFIKAYKQENQLNTNAGAAGITAAPAEMEDSDE